MDNKCENCEKDFNELYSLGQYNGNKNACYYCSDCFKFIHGVPFEDIKGVSNG